MLKVERIVKKQRKRDMPTSLYASILTEYGTYRKTFFSQLTGVLYVKIYEAYSWQSTLIFPKNLGGKVHVMRIFCLMLQNCFLGVTLLTDWGRPPPRAGCISLKRKKMRWCG
jgi:hypothetical protein